MEGADPALREWDNDACVAAAHTAPAQAEPSEINRLWSERGVYFEDADRHLLEMITKPNWHRRRIHDR